MGTTFIYTTKDSGAADAKAGFWSGAGFAVTKIGPTDDVEVTGEASPKLLWESGDEGDWYVVIGTRDPHTDWI